MQIVHSVFSWFVNFCGSIFVYGAIIAAILILIERILYSARRRDDADKTASQAASVHRHRDVTDAGNTRITGKPDAGSDDDSDDGSDDGDTDATDASAATAATEVVAPQHSPASSRRIALITGASSGLGRNLALEMDKNEKGIDEFWLIARRKEKLEALAAELHLPSHILSLDLTLMESSAALAKELQEANVEVGVLVNCAGLGKIGNYQTLTVEENNQMIDLNDRAGVDVTMVSLPYMKQGDRIIEICSTAAFQPLQHFSVYAASKRFLYNYSRALRLELFPRRIPVLVVCPYWMKDTEFISTAQHVKSRSGSADPAADSPIRNFALAINSDKAAARIMRHSRRGYAVSTPGLLCTLHRFFGKLIPTETMLYIWEGFRKL